VLPLAALRLPLQPSPALLAACAAAHEVPLSEGASVYTDYREHAVNKAMGAAHALTVASLLCLEECGFNPGATLSPPAGVWLSSDVQQLLFAALAFAARKLQDDNNNDNNNDDGPLKVESSSSSSQQQQQQQSQGVAAEPCYFRLLLDTLGLSASDVQYYGCKHKSVGRNAFDIIRACVTLSVLAKRSVWQQQQQQHGQEQEQQQQQQQEQDAASGTNQAADTHSCCDEAACQGSCFAATYSYVMLVLLEMLLSFGPRHPVVPLVAQQLLSGCSNLLYLSQRTMFQQPSRVQHLLQMLLHSLPPYLQQVQAAYSASAVLNELFESIWRFYGWLLMRVLTACEWF
jgi:hypothetical protein